MLVICEASIASLKQSSSVIESKRFAETKLGEVISGEREYTEFCAPGVPPAVALLAIQLFCAGQFTLSVGLINSKLHPPSSFTTSLYHACV